MKLSQTYERLLKAAKAVGQAYPYYTPASLRVRFEEREDCPTMGITSKLVIHYNEEFVKNLNDQELEGVVLHECMHYISAHHRRFMENPHRGEVPWQLHNIAQDCEINQHIDPSILPSKAQLPQKYGMPEGKSYEEYLVMLISMMPPSAGSGGGGSSGGKSQSDGSKSDKGKGQNKGNKSLMDGSGNENTPGQSEGDQNDPAQGKSKCGDVDCEGYEGSENQDESTRRQLVSECVESESKAAGRNAGDGHSFAEEMKRIERIKYPWHRVFKSLVSNRISDRVKGFNYRTYRKPNKHLMGTSKSIIHGSYCDYQEHVNLVIGVDISGSMYGLVEKMYGVMKSIVDVEELDISTTILECDTQVSRVIENFDLESSQSSVGQGGGTDMGCIATYIKENNLNPDLIVVMTDNYTDWDPVMFRDKTVVLTTNVTKSCPYKQFLVTF